MKLLLAAEEERRQPGLVDPVIGVMIWTLIVFGLTMLVLWKVAFPRIAEALDKRQKMIEDSIDSAERTQREADELLRGVPRAAVRRPWPGRRDRRPRPPHRGGRTRTRRSPKRAPSARR